jgi:hypothetical protein
MPTRSPYRTVFPRITPDVVRYAYEHLATTNPYYIREVGRDAIRGCMLRVQRQSVEVGTRLDNGTRWHRVTRVDLEMSIDDLEVARLAVRRVIRSREDEDEEPCLRQGRQMTVQQLWQLFRAEYIRKKSSKRSARTLAFYDCLWDLHLLPRIGANRLREVTIARVEEMTEEVTSHVRTSRPWAEGRHTANHCLFQGRTVFEFARRKGWLLKNPFLEVDPYDVLNAQVYLRDLDLAAIGEALRDLEDRARRSSAVSRHVPSLAALYAMRLTLYTGCRHRAELLAGNLTWFKEDLGIPRLEIPRAKGDRNRGQGRFLYLGPHALELLHAIPRPPGSTLLVPGRLAGQPLYRLNETWDAVLGEARRRLRQLQADSQNPLDAVVLQARLAPGEAGDRIPVKVLRHTAKTFHPRAGIASEHSAQLLGHEAATLGERVYLHHHGPSLVHAAAAYEHFVRQLLGDIPVRSADTLTLPFPRTESPFSVPGAGTPPGLQDPPSAPSRSLGADRVAHLGRHFHYQATG